MGGLAVSFVLRDLHLTQYAQRLGELMQLVEQAGLDGVVVGDHVSFQGGSGADGLIQAAALLGAHRSLSVETGIYLLPLRHPVLVARQLATIAMVAPSRFVFGVGIGGEDPHESEVCGVDPRSRGVRIDEALPLVRRLLTGERVSHQGRFFDFVDAVIEPVPSPPVPVIVGGRSNRALLRAGRYADGWIGVWVSARRHREATALVEAEGRRVGRSDISWRHEHQTWCFFDSSPASARDRAAAVMQSAYQLPFERFERYTPCGSPADIADALRPYLAAGCRRFNLVADAVSLEAAVEGAGAVKRNLASVTG